MRVAVLSGGRSSEHEVSLRSGASVAEGLGQAGHEAVAVLIDREGGWSCDGEAVRLAPGTGLLDCEVAFPVLHGPFGEDGTVQGLLECLDLPYVGADVLASALCMDKLSFKRLLAYHRIPQVDFVEAGEDGWRERAASFGLPLWVKPSRLGSSVGISKVSSPERGLDEAVELAARHDVERFLAGELERREALGYPPFRHLVRILVSGRDQEGPLKALEELKAELGGEDVLGPAPMLRLRGRYRAQLVAKTERPGSLAARAARALAAAAPAMRKAGLTVVVDVDPQSL
jgi:hypothetical protein